MTTPGNTNPAILKQMINESMPQYKAMIESEILPLTLCKGVDSFIFDKPIELHENKVYLVFLDRPTLVTCRRYEGRLNLYIDQETEKYSIFEEGIFVSGWPNFELELAIYGPSIQPIDETYEEVPLFDFSDPDRFPRVKLNKGENLEWNLEEFLSEEELVEFIIKLISREQIRIKFFETSNGSVSYSVLLNIYYQEYMGNYNEIYASGNTPYFGLLLSMRPHQPKFKLTFTSYD